MIVDGPDALTYLQSQIAQDIRDLAVGDSCWTLVLEPTGKVESLARVTRSDDEVFDFDTDAGFGEALAARLSRFKIRVQAEISVVPAASADPSAAHESARVAAGWPRMGPEIVPGETIPAVTGVVGVAVSFTKGCYPGQELVERMDTRGAEAPRSLRIVDVGRWRCSVGDPVLDPHGVDDRHDHERLTARRSGARVGQARPRRRSSPGSPLLNLRKCRQLRAACTHRRRHFGSAVQAAGAGERVRRIATTSGFWRMPISSGDPSMIDARPAGDVPASAAVRSQPIATV